MNEVLIYKAKNGQLELKVNLEDETVWLSMNQMVELFGRDKSVISKHLNNIFKIKELHKKSVVAKFATTASDGKTYQVDYYNLDAIISVGYRVNSKAGVQFRKWASQVLKEYLIQGYIIHQKRLAEIGIDELQHAFALLEKTLVQHELVSDLGQEAIQLIISYSKTWSLLLAYDEGQLKLPTQGKRNKSVKLNYMFALSAIQSLKTDLAKQNQASNLFGQERDHAFQSILNNIEQTFDGEQLYKTIEEKAAHLLYFIIKDHPFTDGNKRIGSFIFLLYLRAYNIAIKLNENGLLALALLVAESDPKQKDMLIRLIVNILVN